jgi:ABC-type branched-subunit amino acid transport system ATPase component
MNAHWRAERQRRDVVLREDDTTRLTLPLDQGGRYRIIAPDTAVVHDIVNAVERLAVASVLPAQGGLLGAKTVAANFALALHYGSDARDDLIAEWEDALHVALRLAGLSEERITRIGRELPMNLPRNERWLLGFVRCLLRPPELLVLDRIFSGLTRREAEALAVLELLYHDYHPFRPVLFVDLDTHELPAVTDCRQEIRLTEYSREVACLS